VPNANNLTGSKKNTWSNLELCGSNQVFLLLINVLKEGRYEYKYIIDGEWKCNENEALTSPNGDGHVNNYIEVRLYLKSKMQEAVNLE
jgi:Glycogen recognition site of AMP-activated protein kinase